MRLATLWASMVALFGTVPDDKKADFDALKAQIDAAEKDVDAKPGDDAPSAAKLAAMEAKLDEVKAALAEQATRAANADKALDEQRKTESAKRIAGLIDAAVAAGQIPAKNDDVKKKWTEAFEKDEAGAAFALSQIPTSTPNGTPRQTAMTTGDGQASPTHGKSTFGSDPMEKYRKGAAEELGATTT